MEIILEMKMLAQSGPEMNAWGNQFITPVTPFHHVHLLPLSTIRFSQHRI